MKNNVLYIFLLVFYWSFSSQASFKYKDSDIKELVDKGASLAQLYLSESSKSETGLTLLQFIRSHNPYHPTVASLDVKLEFGKSIEEPSQLISPKSYAMGLWKKAKSLENESGTEEQVLLYFYISSLLDKSFEEVEKELAVYVNAGMDPRKEFKYLLSCLPEDLVVEVQEVKAIPLASKQKNITDLKVKEEFPSVELQEEVQEDPYAKYAIKEELKPKLRKPAKQKLLSSEEIKVLIQQNGMGQFYYSETEVLEGINQLVQQMFSHKVKLSFKSNKVSIVEIEESMEGLKYYYGPSTSGRSSYGYDFYDSDIRDIMDHLCVKNEFDYVIRDGEIQIRDMRYHKMKEEPRDGWDLEQLYPLFKDQYLKTKKKYQKKFIKVKAYATGVRFEGYLHKTARITLNGGAGFIELKPGEYHEDRLNLLAEEISELKRERELEVSVDSRRSIKDSKERSKGENKWNSSVELVFFARVKNIDHFSGMQFDLPRFLFYENEGSCITIRHPNQNDIEEAQERNRI